MTGTVHIVHCVDTEGPMREPLEATFERLQNVWGLTLPVSSENLRKLQRQEIDLGGREAEVAQMIAPHLLAYNETWDDIRQMLVELQSDGFRNQLVDSDGAGWVYNWFCLDHVGYINNPRFKTQGYHAVFDRYRELVDELGAGARDGLHFHFHPMPLNREAEHCATQFFGHSDTLFQILARRVIDRRWFPSTFRPGFHATRPDSHWFLEQFFPFDYANQATVTAASTQPDLDEGRFGDWRRAPTRWSPYHPAHDDYQVEGDCRRWILRCLNVGTRHRLLTGADVEQAFAEADAGAPVVLAFANHDVRDVRRDVRLVRDMLAAARAKFPSVELRFCEARDAARRALKLDVRPPLELEISLSGTRLHVRADRDTFGPQPFLALKTREGTYHHDNFDFQRPRREWSYVFDEQTIPVPALDEVGVASCDDAGGVSVAVLNLGTGVVDTQVW